MLESNGIMDLEVFVELEQNDLKDMGMTVLGDRKRVMLAIKKACGGGSLSSVPSGGDLSEMMDSVNEADRCSGRAASASPRASPRTSSATVRNLGFIVFFLLKGQLVQRLLLRGHRPEGYRQSGPLHSGNQLLRRATSRTRPEESVENFLVFFCSFCFAHKQLQRRFSSFFWISSSSKHDICNTIVIFRYLIISFSRSIVSPHFSLISSHLIPSHLISSHSLISLYSHLISFSFSCFSTFSSPLIRCCSHLSPRLSARLASRLAKRNLGQFFRNKRMER
jgi:hypothetical protein